MEYLCPVVSSSIFFFFPSPILSGRRLDAYHTSTHGVALVCEFRTQVWKLMCCTWLAGNTGRKNDAKNRHLRTIAQLCPSVSSQLRHISTIEKKLVKSNISPTCPHNMANFGPLTAEIGSGVWGTPANFNGFRVLAALLYGTLVGVGETLRRWTEGATYIQQGGHHVGHWPTF